MSNQRKSRPEEGATQKIPQNDLQFGFECCELLLVKVKKRCLFGALDLQWRMLMSKVLVGAKNNTMSAELGPLVH